MKRFSLAMMCVVAAAALAAAVPCLAGVGTSASIPETPYNTNRSAGKTIDIPDENENATGEQDLEGLEVSHPMNSTHETWHDIRESQKDE